MSRPAVIAHRGFAGVAPENTVAAATDAVASGAAMVEIDVRPAARGTPVVFHDDRLDGLRDGRPLTDATGLVRETPLEEVTAAEVLESGETVPTLSALLDALPAAAGVNVELKACGTPTDRFGESLSDGDRDPARARWTPFVERVVADCDAFDGDLLFSSFYEGAVSALRNVAPEYPVAPLVWDDIEVGLEVARRYDCEAIHPPRNAIAGTPLAETSYDVAELPAGEANEIDLLETAREEGRAVNVWTVDTWIQFDQLADAGVDGIVAEYPGLDGPRER